MSSSKTLPPIPNNNSSNNNSAASSRVPSASNNHTTAKTKQLQKQAIALAKSANLPEGLVSMILPSSVGLVINKHKSNPRYQSASRLAYSGPTKGKDRNGATMLVGGPINSKYKPVNRGFSYSFPGMFQDTGIGSLEKEVKW